LWYFPKGFPLIWFVDSVVGLFIAVYLVLATGSLLVGLVRFLIAAPGAIRQDMERWRATHPRRQRMIRYVRNEAENATEPLESPRALPPPDEETS
jgi:hypothetical protein